MGSTAEILKSGGDGEGGKNLKLIKFSQKRCFKEGRDRGPSGRRGTNKEVKGTNGCQNNQSGTTILCHPERKIVCVRSPQPSRTIRRTDRT